MIVKHLPAIQNFGSIDILCSDKTGTLTSGVMQFDRAVDPTGAASPRPLTLASINSSFETGIRSPLDAAILQQAAADVAGYQKVDEIPFDFERRRLSVVVEAPDGDGRRLLITKGAPESIIERSTAFEAGGAGVPLDAASPAGVLSPCTSGERGRFLRAGGRLPLAGASRRLLARRRGRPRAGRLRQLRGPAALPDVADVLAELKRDGVTVKILTGDNERVARHVCRAIALDERQIVTGDDIARTDDAALGHLAEQASVFARVSPAQKNRIILALKRRGHVVGYMGDGINDAPSLHTADVGISVMTAPTSRATRPTSFSGSRAFGAAPRILEGRRASGNMMKYLLMGTSSNFGNMFSMAGAARCSCRSCRCCRRRSC